MRYDTEHKQRTRQRVLDIAARTLREQGVARVGVKPLMAEAGLTHGGFYAHFASKDALVAAAIDRMFDQTAALAQTWLQGDGDTHGDGGGGRAGLSTYIDHYLAPVHRDAPGQGCPVAALAGEVAHLGDAPRARFAAGLERLQQQLSTALAAAGYAEPEHLAGSLIAEMSGALCLARAVTDPAHSDRILTDSRRAVRARLDL